MVLGFDAKDLMEWRGREEFGKKRKIKYFTSACSFLTFSSLTEKIQFRGKLSILHYVELSPFPFIYVRINVGFCVKFLLFVDDFVAAVVVIVVEFSSFVSFFDHQKSNQQSQQQQRMMLCFLLSWAELYY